MSKPRIRCVTFLITDVAVQSIADNITIVKVQLQENMENFNTNIKTMRDAVEHVTEAAKAIIGKMEEFNDSFQETADQLAQATQELVEKTTEKAPDHGYQPPTYAATAQYQLHPIHEAVIMRGEIVDKQILSKCPGSMNGWSGNISCHLK